MNSQTRKLLAIILGDDLPVALQMHWAASVANARRLDILVYQPVESKSESVVEVALAKPPAGMAKQVIQDLQAVIESSSRLRKASIEEDSNSGPDVDETTTDEIQVRLRLISFASESSLRQTLLEELGTQGITLVTAARQQISDTSDTEMVRERRLFLRYIPCEALLCTGLQNDSNLARILVATKPGSNGRAALKLGQDLASIAGGSLTALHINPDVGQDAEQVGERRLVRFLKKASGVSETSIIPRVIVNDNVTQGIRDVWDEGLYDLVISGAAEFRFEESIGARLGKDVPNVLVHTASPVTNRLREFVEEGLRMIVPQIERDDRVSLVDRVQSSADWNFDFLTLMVLSTIMASIGLIQNSAAVVIGAMLVAPLMVPLLGLGLAMVQGNQSLANMSLRSIMLGLAVSLLVGVVVGVCTPGFEEPTREMLARGGPGLLDLAVAFAAGLAAAYASSRPGLIAALPGVAIAAALVPPIATSGLALTLGDFHLALGALLLFVINMVTIVLASMASLWAVGIRNLTQKRRWSMRAGTAIVFMVLSLGIFLSLKSQEHELTEQLPLGLLEAVRENIGTNHQLENLAIAYDELGVQLNVQIVGNIPATSEMANTVRNLVSGFYIQPVRVRLLTRIALSEALDE